MLMTSFNLNYLLKSLSPNMVTRWFRASKYETEAGEATSQSITDINYVSVSVPLTVASVLSGLNIFHRVEKIFLNA